MERRDAMNGTSEGSAGLKSLDEVLDEYLEASAGPSLEKLGEWINRYPEYAHDLVELTMHWGLANSQAVRAEDEVESKDERTELMSLSRRILDELWEGEPGAKEAKKSSMKGLINEGQARNMPVKALAEALDLTIPIVAKLDRGLIEYSSIPGGMVRRIADVLERSVEEVKTYLQLGPRLAASTSYKAEEAPKLGEQETFSHAVRSDRMMGSEQRQRLLDLDD